MKDTSITSKSMSHCIDFTKNMRKIGVRELQNKRYNVIIHTPTERWMENDNFSRRNQMGRIGFKNSVIETMLHLKSSNQTPLDLEYTFKIFIILYYKSGMKHVA
jgi:hypothetical protein